MLHIYRFIIYLLSALLICSSCSRECLSEDPVEIGVKMGEILWEGVKECYLCRN